MLKSLIFLCLPLVCLGVSGCDDSTPTQTQAASSHADSLGRGVPSSVTNDAELLVYRCGEPDQVLDTSYDDPRPLIVSRIVTYKKAHLRIMYVPHDPVDQPPPYHWKLMGFVDTRTKKGIDPDEWQYVLQQRLPCLLGK
jgi:hypothetical protein